MGTIFTHLVEYIKSSARDSFWYLPAEQRGTPSAGRRASSSSSSSRAPGEHQKQYYTPSRTYFLHALDTNKKRELASSTTVEQRITTLGYPVVLKAMMLLLHDGVNWMERASLDGLWSQILRVMEQSQEQEEQAGEEKEEQVGGRERRSSTRARDEILFMFRLKLYDNGVPAGVDRDGAKSMQMRGQKLNRTGRNHVIVPKRASNPALFRP